MSFDSKIDALLKKYRVKIDKNNVRAHLPTKNRATKVKINYYETFKDYYLNKRKQFIDEYDLELYRNKQTGKIEFIAEVSINNNCLINDICITFVVCLYNKRVKTHKVPASGLALISTAKIYDSTKINEISKYKTLDYIKVIGKIQATTIDDMEIPYIEAINIESSTKEARDELIKH